VVMRNGKLATILIAICGVLFVSALALMVLK
jgi:hypothetical protein